MRGCAFFEFFQRRVRLSEGAGSRGAVSSLRKTVENHSGLTVITRTVKTLFVCQTKSLATSAFLKYKFDLLQHDERQISRGRSIVRKEEFVCDSRSRGRHATSNETKTFTSRRWSSTRGGAGDPEVCCYEEGGDGGDVGVQDGPNGTLYCTP